MFVARLSIHSISGPLAVGLLLAANALVPALCGDIYPFTTGPMFRDAPTQYADYRLFDPSGNELPRRHYALDKDKTDDPFLIGRVYDGNPVGYGVGIAPPPVLEQEFGVVHDEAAVRRHIQKQLARPENAKYDYVTVVQKVIGSDGQRVGVVESNKNGPWKVDRPPGSTGSPFNAKALSRKDRKED
jgi:hypothetical protein